MDSKFMSYVLGFMFDPKLENVLLIKKTKPEWQAGLLNGVGGKVERGENEFEAIVREFKEETGIITRGNDWTPFCDMGGNDFNVCCYHAVGDIYKAQTMTEEPVEIHPVSKRYFPEIHHLSWLIPLALDSMSGEGKPKYTQVHF